MTVCYFHVFLPNYLIRNSKINFDFTEKTFCSVFLNAWTRFFIITLTQFIYLQKHIFPLYVLPTRQVGPRSRASRAVSGIDLEVDWAPTFTAEWGSVDLPICICVVPGLLGEVRF
jgi:hypothetical protein